VLSDDLRDNVRAKLAHKEKVRVIPNFVDTEWIQPGSRDNGYRREHGLTGKFVVMYAGNVGLSQPLDLVLDAARAFVDQPDVVFVINGQGAGRAGLEARAACRPRPIRSSPRDALSSPRWTVGRRSRAWSRARGRGSRFPRRTPRP
jgi:glycosyltransferase involved in cell wall biosynthesis